MNRIIPFATLLLLAGCAAPPSATVDNGPEPLEDSLPVHESHELSQGIHRDWSFTVGEPAAGSGLLRFKVSGPEGTPVRMPDVCLEYRYEQRASSGTRTSEGRQGMCGGSGNLAIAPAASPDGQLLFQLAGGDVLPGTYSFHADGGPQVASLFVDLVPR